MGKIKQPYILIFKKNSIKNRYLGIFKNLRKHKQNMIFHVVAIKELFWKNYSLDVLFFWLSEEKIRDILRAYKLVALQLYEYKKEKVEGYWAIKILIEFEWQEIRLLSNADELEWISYWLSVLWFDIKNINYVDDRKLEQEKINELLNTAKNDAKQWIQEQQDIELQKKKKEEAFIEEDTKLKKTLTVTNELLKKIPELIRNAENYIPKERLKELFKQGQELSKLKMWRNVEKLSALLEKSYNLYNEIEQEYLAAQQTSRNIGVSWSNVSDTYVTSEIQKLEKAKWLSKASMANKWEDILYARLWWFLVYLKLVIKDLISKLKNIKTDFPKIFSILLIWLIFRLIVSALYIWLYKTMYLENMNDYAYVILVNFWVFWLVLYGLNFLKKEKIIFNIMLLLWWILVSILLIIVLKQNFIF